MNKAQLAGSSPDTHAPHPASFEKWPSRPALRPHRARVTAFELEIYFASVGKYLFLV